MVSAAVAVFVWRCNLFSRCRASGLSRWCPQLTSRWVATQTTSAAADQNNNNDMRSSIPWLMVSSGTTNPCSHYVYNLAASRSDVDPPKVDHLELDRELSLPKISKNLMVGSSQGYLIFMPISSPVRNIHAINPITGHVIHIPPVPCFYCDPEGTKVILSPSLDMAVIIPDHENSPPSSISYVRLPCTHKRLFYSSAFCWNTLPLPYNMGKISDCIFHKGCLCVVDLGGSVAIYDEHFFQSEEDILTYPSHWTFFWHRYDIRGRDTGTINSRLMESHDGKDLYALFRDSRLPFWFTVFKLDRGFRHWEEVESVGDDSVLFVGNNHAISLSAHDFPLLQSDSIYFTGYGFSYNSAEYITGAYYLKSLEIEVFRSTNEDQIPALTDAPSIWFKPVASCAASCPVITQG